MPIQRDMACQNESLCGLCAACNTALMTAARVPCICTRKVLAPPLATRDVKRISIVFPPGLSAPKKFSHELGGLLNEPGLLDERHLYGLYRPSCSLSVGDASSLFLRDGRIYFWGAIPYGKPITTPEFIPLPGGVECRAIAAGYGEKLAIGLSGEVYSWDYEKAPQLVSLLRCIECKAISSGCYNNLALGMNGNIYSWDHGRSWAPTQGFVFVLPSLMECTAIASGRDYNLVLDANGNIYYWREGYNAPGEKPPTPQFVVMPGGVKCKAISAGDYYHLALGINGEVYNWRDEYDPPQAVAMPGGLKCKAISAGGYYNLALGINGEVYYWDHRQGVAPQLVHVLRGVKCTAIGAGENYCLALAANGKIYSWGNDLWKQLGHTGDITRPKIVELPPERTLCSSASAVAAMAMPPADPLLRSAHVSSPASAAAAAIPPSGSSGVLLNGRVCQGCGSSNIILLSSPTHYECRSCEKEFNQGRQVKGDCIIS
jgi:hypothetical protein